MAGAGAGAEIMDKGGAGAEVGAENNNFGSATLVKGLYLDQDPKLGQISGSGIK